MNNFRYYTTLIHAINPKNGNLVLFSGPYIIALSFEDAQRYCDENGLGYCKVDGMLEAVIPCKSNTFIPDWNNQSNEFNLN